MSRAFVLHKRENLQKARHIVQRLRGAGLDVWWITTSRPTPPAGCGAPQQ